MMGHWPEQLNALSGRRSRCCGLLWPALIILTLIGFVAPGVLAASSTIPIIDSSKGKVSLGAALRILQENTGPENHQEVWDKLRNGQGYSRDGLSDTVLFGSDVYWISVDIKTDASTAGSWFFDLGYQMYRRVDFFLQSEAGLLHKVSGTSSPWHKRDFPYEAIAFETTLKPNQSYSALFRIDSGNYIQFSLWLMPRMELARWSRTLHFATALVLGLFLAIFIYNLFIYLQTRDPTTGSFVCALFALSCYYTCYRTIPSEYIFGNLGMDYPMLVFGVPGFFLYLMMASGIDFVRRILDLKKHESKIDQWLRALTVIVLAVSPLWMFEEAWWNLLRVSHGLVALSSVLVLTGLARSFAKKDPVTRLFILAQMPIVAGGITMSVVYNGAFSSQERTLAVIFASFCIALSGLAYSMVLGNRFDRDRKKRLELQETMTEQLELEVEQRTDELAHKTLEAQEATIEALTARDQAEFLHQKAETQAKELEVLSKAKTSFFQNISHELRTPLTLILNPLEVLSSDIPDNKNASIALKNARRLLRLVNQLLDFQKLEAGKRKLTLMPIDLCRFSVICEDYFESACSTKGVEFCATYNGQILDKDLKPIFMLGEVDALEKVVFNYLSNALKYTPASGQIELGLADAEGELTIFVRDTGPGISQEGIEKLFQVFSQVEDSTTREYEGTGLGLALVKSLVEEMGGSVGVDSVVGEGSVFWARFPVCDDVDGDENLEFTPREWLIPVAEGKTGDTVEQDKVIQGAAEGEGELVLVVDDLVDMRELVGDSLLKQGYRIVKASNGRRGLEIAKEIKPGLIITDWMMPQMSGPELIEAVRQDQEISSIPIVLLTAKSDEESKLLGTEIGADAFVGKPFNDRELMSVVRNLLSLKTREHEVEELNRLLTETVLKRYLPPDLVDQIVRGEISIEQEPENIIGTVIFSDLVGFTELSGRLRAAKLARILNEYLSAMVAVIYEHGGTIDKFIGDAIMVIFGAPKSMPAHEQVIRATDCSRAMQAKLKELNFVKFEEASRLSMRIGIHHGPVVVGTFGSAERSDYTVIGPTVNIASRIEGKCFPGAVFVSEDVCSFLPESGAVKVGEFELKGIEGKQTLYRLEDSLADSEIEM